MEILSRSLFLGFLSFSLLLGSTTAYAGAPYSLPRKCIQVMSRGYFYGDLEKKSPLAPQILPVRLYTNIKRWHFSKDTRDLSEKPFDFLNDYHYLTKKRENDKLGIVRSIFSEKYDTRLYFTATGVPDMKGQIPVVDPKSRGVIFYFHGSGTMKASGANFAYKMNKMAALGYTVIAMDLPWHSDGSQSSRMTTAENFYNQLREMTQEYRLQDKPVYLAGHSFGPDIVAEFAKRFPFDLDGGVMISPGGFTKELEHWYTYKTSQMTALWGDLVQNEDGAAWAGLMATQHLWKRKPTEKHPDPTKVNPKLKMHILTGEFEEYVPGPLDSRGLPTKEPRTYDMVKPLKELMSGADIVVEPGVGHYIFEHKDANGHDVILRELLRVDGESLNNEKELKATANYNKLSDDLEMARRYARDPFFRSWVDATQGGLQAITTMMEQGDLVTARRLSNNYARYVEAQRDRIVVENIIRTQTWNPDFYNANKTEIEALNPQKPRPSDGLINKYVALLETLTPEQRSQYASATKDIYVIPEKQIPTIDPEKQKFQLEKKKQKYEQPKEAG